MSHIEVFVLNHNGARFLRECLSSLLTLDRGKHSLGISVVDNASTDESAKVVGSFDGINFIGLGKNLGFSKGNNLGVRKRLHDLKKSGKSADYICFLNNDTRVEKAWLTSAIGRLEQDGSIGIVGSKSLFYDSYVEIQVTTDRSLGADQKDSNTVVIHPIKNARNIKEDPKRTKWIGWSAPDEYGCRYANSTARILLAIEDPQAATEFNLIFENRGTTTLNVNIKLANRSDRLTLAPYASGEICASVSSQELSTIIQNAGSFVTESWDAGDIAMFSPDSGTREEACEVPAICGVSMFIRRSLFEKLRGFDESFFAYYEDVDLSLRARAKGYSCWYEPQSRLYHIHCGSGVEWSPYFILNVTFSQLVFSSRWMNIHQFIRKLRDTFNNAWRELKLYSEDQNLENKPNLITIIRLLKRPLMIPLNRIYHLRHSMIIPSLPMAKSAGR